MHRSEEKSTINIYKLNNTVKINNADFVSLNHSTNCLTIRSSFWLYSLHILNPV